MPIICKIVPKTKILKETECTRFLLWFINVSFGHTISQHPCLGEMNIFNNNYQVSSCPKRLNVTDMKVYMLSTDVEKLYFFNRSGRTISFKPGDSITI